MTIARDQLARRYLAGLICAAALLLKLLVPSGYMLDTQHGRITVIICSGMAPRTMAMDVSMRHDDTSDPSKGGKKKADMPCAFSGLSAPVLGVADAFQIAALILFVMALWRASAVAPAPDRRLWLRPPLRGPPIPL